MSGHGSKDTHIRPFNFSLPPGRKYFLDDPTRYDCPRRRGSYLLLLQSKPLTTMR